MQLNAFTLKQYQWLWAVGCGVLSLIGVVLNSISLLALLLPLVLAGLFGCVFGIYLYARISAVALGIMALGVLLLFDASYLLLVLQQAILFAGGAVVVFVWHQKHVLTQEWMPSAQILSGLAVFMAVAFFLVAILVHVGGESLPALLVENIQTASQHMAEPQQADVAGAQDNLLAVITQLPALFFAVVGWLLAVQLLLPMLLAHFIARSYRIPLRPRLQMELFLPSRFIYWGVLAAMAMAILMPSSVAYIPQAIVLFLAMPYFGVVASLMHVWARQRPGRGLWLGLFYSSIFMVWPAIMIALLGFFLQTRAIITGVEYKR